MAKTRSKTSRPASGISADALAKARAEDAEIHRPIREANERARQWLDVARHAQACREYAHKGYKQRTDPPGVLVEQSGYARDPVVDPEVNLHVSRRWVTEFWGELIKHLPPVMDRAAVAALAAPEGFRPQAKLAFEAVQAQFVRRMGGAKIDAIVPVVCQMRATLGAERSLVGCFFEPLEQLARLRQAQASEEESRIARELRARARGKSAAVPRVDSSSGASATMVARPASSDNGEGRCATYTLSPSANKILRYLHSQDTPRTTPMIAEATHLKPKSIGKNLSELKNRTPPLIENFRRRGYVLTDHGRQVAVRLR